MNPVLSPFVASVRRKTRAILATFLPVIFALAAPPSTAGAPAEDVAETS